MLALACAATGDFEQATEIQEALLAMAVWTMPAEAARLEKGLAAYREEHMPVYSPPKTAVEWVVRNLLAEAAAVHLADRGARRF